MKSETRNPKPEIGNRKSEIRNQKSEIRNQKSEIRNQKSEIRNQKSEIRNQKSEIRNQISEIRNQKSEIRNQESGIGNRKSEIGNRKSEQITSHLCDVGYYVGSTHNALYPTILPCMWGGGRKGGGEGMTEWESSHFGGKEKRACRLLSQRQRKIPNGRNSQR